MVHGLQTLPGSISADRLTKMGMVLVRGFKPVCVPAGTIKVVAATCPRARHCTTDPGLVEPLTTKSCLPAGVLVSPAVGTDVKVDYTCPHCEVDVGLYPHTTVGIWGPTCIVSLTEGVTEVRGAVQVTIYSQVRSVKHLDVISKVDLSALNYIEQ